MSLQSAIDNLKDRVSDAYDALEAKGATMPSTKNTANLPTSIGSIVELKGETKSASPSTSQQIITPTSGKNGITQMTILPVTSSIDANIVASNIKKDVSILGVTGNYEGSGGGGLQGYNLTLVVKGDQNSTKTIQIFHPDGTSENITATGTSPATASNVAYFIGDVHSNNEGYIAESGGNYYFLLLEDTTIYVKYSCILKGAQVSLSNGLLKNIEDITYDDELLTWDFDEGKFSSAKPVWIRKQGIADYWFENELANGMKISIVGESSTGWGHRGLNVTRGSFKYFPQSVGDKFSTLNGDSELIMSKKVFGKCEYYNIITDRHFNMYVNGILTSCSLNNIYPIQEMKFVKDERAFRKQSDYSGVPDEYFTKLRLAENTGDIGELNAYVQRLLTVRA